MPDGTEILLDGPVLHPKISCAMTMWLVGMFHDHCREAGILHDNEQIFQYLGEVEDKRKRRLFCI